jgi:hypothetical protein
LAATGVYVGTVRAHTPRLAGDRGELLMEKSGLILGEIDIKKAFTTHRGGWLSRESTEALHEAGHAIAAVELGVRVNHVTLVNEYGDGAGGECEVDAPDWLVAYLRGKRPTRGHEQHDPKRRELLRRYAIQSVAGIVAERRLVRRPPAKATGRHGSDEHDALICARLLGFRGTRATAFVLSMEKEADAILARRWPEVINLAQHVETRWMLRRVGPDDLAAIIKEARAR